MFLKSTVLKQQSKYNFQEPMCLKQVGGNHNLPPGAMQYRLPVSLLPVSSQGFTHSQHPLLLTVILQLRQEWAAYTQEAPLQEL